MNILTLALETGSTGAMVLSLIAMIGIMIIAYYLTRWVGNRSISQYNSRFIKIVDKIAISQDKLLLVVKVAEKTMLIGMSGNTISKICDVDAEEEVEDFMNKRDKTPFNTILKNSIKDCVDKNKQP